MYCRIYVVLSNMFLCSTLYVGNDLKLTNVFKMVWSQQGIDTSCLWFQKKNPPVARRMGGKGEQNSASDKAIKGELFEMMTEFPGPGL